MRRLSLIGIVAIAVLAAGGCIFLGISEKATLSVAQGTGPAPTLPEPNKTLLPTVNIAPAVGWPEGTTPTPANGLAVTSFAAGLDHPRWLYVLPNGDVLVAESNAPPKPEGSGGGLKGWITGIVMKRAGARTPSANRITLLRDTNGDGVADHRSVFLENLYSPFGMTLVGNDFYVANANALMRYSYRPGADRIDAPGEKVVDLPAGLNHHWTKNVIASRDGSKLYITVGSNSNVGENGMEAEEGRAAIWELDRASGKMRPFATGLRNPNGLDWEPQTGALWTAVNERDEIGSDLVPDYITSVKDGGFYGWPYSYWGGNVDARVKPQRPELVAQAIAPDYALGPHTASLGIVFGERVGLPAPYREGLFVGQHGSWNRKPKSGYKVVFVPFQGGKPAGEPVDVLTGFLDDKEQARGRPVDVKGDGRGGLLVTDDVGNRIWRVSAAAGQ
ncbi:sorbosone dehydrogenase family protein [Cupriavidus sp. AU9028]|uniref:PQQ-dependent sugar dehydrogenase n=1 Tax=Cupriavidus sp. AU9028 TaxID=2871157 RepID=UPI001C95AB88|nr:sorbosone dehydrogenase family protein [Cupriavidus sp. AU9028]MBY4899072.1 sorbosone dehydrogenase family protein [Cupriavidus sp. AU9028]